MDRAKFFAELRKKDSGVFGTALTQGQVDGLSRLLDVWAKWYKDQPVVFLAAALTNIYRETGGRMQPVLETYAPDRSTAALRLQKAFKAGKLKWVKTPYWVKDPDGNIWVGGGDIQLTFKANYVKAEQRLKTLFGVDIPLSTKPDLILDPVVSAHVAFSGMIHGWFTSEDLGDHLEKDGSVDWVDSRSIVNGDEKHIASELRVAGNAFWRALKEAGADKGLGSPEKDLYFPGQKRDVPAKPTTPVKPPAADKKTTLGDLIGLVIEAIVGIFVAIFNRRPRE